MIFFSLYITPENNKVRKNDMTILTITEAMPIDYNAWTNT